MFVGLRTLFSPRQIWERIGDAYQVGDILESVRWFLKAVGIWSIIASIAAGISESFSSSPLTVQILIVACSLLAISACGLIVIVGIQKLVPNPVRQVQRVLLQTAYKTERSGWRPEYKNAVGAALSGSFADELDHCPSDESKIEHLRALAARTDGSILRQSRLQRATEAERRCAPATQLDRVRPHIESVIAMIPVLRSPGTADIISTIARTTHAHTWGSPVRDWKAETKSAVRGLFNDRIVKEYEKRLKTDQPELSATEYLRSLAITLSASDLRNYDQPPETPSKPDSP